MAITQDEVRRIAKLAHLDFTEEEYQRFTKQLRAILDYVAHLDFLETDNIEPTAHLRSGSNVLRKDMVTGSISQEEALANAPESDRGLFKVPRVIG